MEINEVLVQIVNFLTSISSQITQWVGDIFTSLGVESTQRFAGLMSFLIMALILFLCIKYIVKPALKISIGILIGLLILSFFVPNW